MHSYKSLRATILGMARQGLAVARFLLENGARVTLSDQRSPDQLAAAMDALAKFAGDHGTHQPQFVLGGHPASLLDSTDLLLLSGGVSPGIPLVQLARQRGIALSNDGDLTLRHCPAPVIGITGSAGKTTTTTLAGLMLEAAGYRVHVGGNIGTPLIDRLEEISIGDKVVMELSSFQLELMEHSPTIAAVINITPNHLDRHPSMSHYAGAKANILRYQERGDTAVLNADDSYTGPWLATCRVHIDAGEGQTEIYFPLRATALGFSLNKEVAAGAFLAGDRLVLRLPGHDDSVICHSEDVRLRGRHNLANVLAAACLSSAAGAPVEAIASAASTFGGVEHRLEIVREHNGVTWVNDSIATAPERTVAAIRSFTEPLVLLLGGRDKNLPWEECATAIHAGHVRHVVLFGEAAELISEALVKHERQGGIAPIPMLKAGDLPAAVAAAERLAHAGDVILLAPGGTSFDAYEDFTVRGQHFRDLVEALP